MNLFTLQATLGLDATSFDSGVQDAKGSMQGLQTDISGKVTSIDDEIAALDRELKNLETEIADLELDIELDDLESEIDTLTKDIKKQDFKTAFMEGFYDGLADTTGELLQQAIEAGFEFIGDSVEKAASSGTAAADEYNTALAKMELGTQNLQTAIGSKLLPILTSAYEGIASLLGVSDWDLSASMLDQLNSYEFENLKQAEQSLQNIFSFGEEFKPGEAEFDFDSVLASFESQTQYFEQYAETMKDLQSRGFTREMLAQYSSGSIADYSRLSWISSLSDAQLAQLSEASTAVDAARSETAAYLSALQLMNDQAYQEMSGEYSAFMDTLDRGGGRRFGEDYESMMSDRKLFGTSNWEQIMQEPDIAAQISALSASVDALNATISVMNSKETEVVVNVSVDGEEIGAAVTPIVERNMARSIGNQTRG